MPQQNNELRPQDVEFVATRIGEWTYGAMAHLPTGRYVSGETRRGRAYLRRELKKQLIVKLAGGKNVQPD